MSDYTVSIVTKPEWFRIAPSRQGWGKRPAYVIGFDSEAYNGSPICLQFSLPDTEPDQTDIVWTNGKKVLEDFLAYLEPIARKYAYSHRIILAGFNLRYEYSQLFRNIQSEAWEQSAFTLHWHDGNECTGTDNDDWGISLEALNEKRYSFTVKYSHSHRSLGVKCIDAMAYFVTSLEKAAAIVGVDGKDKLPDGLIGHLSLAKAKKHKAFIRYAKRDAWITRKLGETIVGYHVDYDTKMTISAPMLAAQIFKRRFLRDEIPLCNEALEAAGLASYHGGKNGIYIERPMTFDSAYDYDLNAAYTAAMSSLPDPTQAEWEPVTEYESNIHGIYDVVATVSSCTYRAFQRNSGHWYTWRDDGTLGFWVTSYELDAAIAHGEVEDIHDISGFVMRGPSGGPLLDYCTTFAKLKREGKTLTERTFGKLMNNSLYGKLIQKVPSDGSAIPTFDVIEGQIIDANMKEGGYRAGGLYHPALASLVTGYVRARIHHLEHRYQSLMTSTDGFLSLVKPDWPDDLGDHVGGLKMERGSLTIWRERLYAFTPEGGHDPCNEPTCTAKHTIAALHGFRGRLPDLRKVPVEPIDYQYAGRQMIGLRESLRQWHGKRYRPGTFADMPYELKLSTVGDRSPLRPL